MVLESAAHVTDEADFNRFRAALRVSQRARGEWCGGNSTQDGTAAQVWQAFDLSLKSDQTVDSPRHLGGHC